MTGFKIKGFGRRRDYNDPRDFTPETLRPLYDEARTTTHKSKLKTLKVTALKESLFNEQWISGITDQRNLGSCVPSATTSLFEYFTKKAYGSGGAFTEGSRLHLYKTTRFLMGEEGIGDTGAYIRTAFGAARMFGIAPEEYWPYTDKDPDFDQWPEGYKGLLIGDMAQNWKSVKQMRLDYSPNGEQNIQNIKEYLAKGYAATFGFTVFDSYTQADNNEGCIPYPSKGDRIMGGHAINIVGYDDNTIIQNKNDPATQTKGAFIIQNSWGKDWGANGFGKLPYKYFKIGANGDVLADDVWTITKLDWLQTGEFFY